ncbi:TonB-dependent receptor, partial [Nevskia sp.]|uniref:TonB-dependent receptor domain-containing protein n=1 Tax=Nevskia sp. TaxID=1929292 RepID=UPI0025FCF163
RERRALFKQQVIGGETTATGAFETGPLAHRWVAGFELERIRTMQSRNGTERNLTAGTETSTIGPDAFPVRDFPITHTIEAGFYAQDDIRYGALTVIPGLRVDYYDLDPRPDSIFIEDNPGVEPSGLNKLNLSPKLGLVWRFNERLSAYGNYARGFRAPPYSDVNVGFTNFQFGYTAVPNPDLKPETSNSFEVGLRGGVEDATASVAAFYNRYRNFIQSFVSQGVNADGLLVFQSQNLTKVRIFGAEAKGELGGALLDASLKDFRLRGALAWAKGDDLSAHVPLNSIDPLTGVVGLAWRPAALPVSAELVSTMTIEDSRTDNSNGQGYQAPGTVRVDLLGEWQVTPKADFNLGLFNLGDRRIVPAASVQGRLANDPAIDRFSQTGFNVGANVRLRF